MDANESLNNPAMTYHGLFNALLQLQKLVLRVTMAPQAASCSVVTPGHVGIYGTLGRKHNVLQ